MHTDAQVGRIERCNDGLGLVKTKSIEHLFRLVKAVHNPIMSKGGWVSSWVAL